MPAATDSKVAYNLARFDRRALVREQVEKERAESITREKSHARVKEKAKTKSAVSGFSIFCGVVVFAMLLALLFSYVNLTEASDISRRKQLELEKLREENQMLAINYDQRVGALNVREYAVTRLGMSKIDKSQIRYVETPNVDVFEVAEEKKKEETGLIAGLADGFSTIIEFIN